jgi:hypothetical protein
MQIGAVDKPGVPVLFEGCVRVGKRSGQLGGYDVLERQTAGTCEQESRVGMSAYLST